MAGAGTSHLATCQRNRSLRPDTAGACRGTPAGAGLQPAWGHPHRPHEGRAGRSSRDCGYSRLRCSRVSFGQCPVSASRLRALSGVDRRGLGLFHGRKQKPRRMAKEGGTFTVEPVAACFRLYQPDGASPVSRPT